MRTKSSRRSRRWKLPTSPKLSLPGLLIRADCSTETGVGHVMRCLALAETWQSEAASAEFLTSCSSAHIGRRVRSAGVGFSSLARPHPDTGDLPATLERLTQLTRRDGRRPWLVLDGYHFDTRYQERVREAGWRVLVVDDGVRSTRCHATLLLNQNINAEQIVHPCPGDALQLLGNNYVLLHPSFMAWRNWQRPIPVVARRVLVTLGGGDPDNVTLRVLRALEHVTVNQLEVTVAIGAVNPHLEVLKAFVAGSRLRARLVLDVRNMPELMSESDVAVATGGSTYWELAFMGLPTFVLVLAENQRDNAEGLRGAGAACTLDDSDWFADGELASHLTRICVDQELRRNLSRCARTLVDGEGCTRVLTTVSGFEDTDFLRSHCKVRSAVLADGVSIWHLANDSGVRLNSLSPKPIPLDQHLVWFREKVTSTSSSVWVIDLSGTIVALARYDRVDQDAVEVDFAVASGLRGRGIGPALLAETAGEACRRMGATLAKGVVIKGNTASERAFVRAGFSRAGEVERKGCQCSVFQLPVSKSIDSPDVRAFH